MEVNYGVEANGFCSLKFQDYLSVFSAHGTSLSLVDGQFYERNQISPYGEWIVPDGKEVFFVGGRSSIEKALKKMAQLKFMFPFNLGAKAYYKHFKSGNILKDNFTVLVIMKGTAVQPKNYKSIGSQDVVFEGDRPNFQGTHGDRINIYYSCMQAEQLAELIRNVN